mmetsp:Transcript_32077/g.92159  ORF Transcript_32077/g.92159 Transcript_32077/m.92159 type:complete len:291 (+) Transcript_32077:70-942(+)
MSEDAPAQADTSDPVSATAEPLPQTLGASRLQHCSFVPTQHSPAMPARLRLAECPEAGIVGFRVWRAARLLCRYLEQREAGLWAPPLAKATLRAGCRVLELGAGCGLVGIACAHLGAEATLTDAAEVLPMTRRNVGANPLPASAGRAIRVRELAWGCDVREAFPRGSFDLVLGSDLTYYQSLYNPLLLTLLQLVDEESEVLLAHVQRRDELRRWQACCGQYFSIEAVATDSEISARAPVERGGEDEEGGPSDGDDSGEESLAVTVYRMRLRGQPPTDDEVAQLLAGLRTL